VKSEELEELIHRVQEVDNSNRAVAQKMGQLYLYADDYKLEELTKALDKPMRNASDNQQAFAAIPEELRQVNFSQH